jgi:hypothetical protein
MTKKKMRAYRMSEEAMANVERLATAWGGIKPLDATSVIEHALRLAVRGLGAPPKKNPYSVSVGRRDDRHRHGRQP